MYGYIEEGTRGSMERRQILGMWLVHVTLPTEGAFCRIRRRRMWRALQRAGVRRAVMTAAVTEESARWGIAPVEVFPLRRALLPQLLDLLPPMQGKTAALTALGLTTDVETAACELARRCRYLRVEMGRGREELARRLYCRFGLTVGGAGSPTVTVCFHGTAAGRCLCLGEDCAAYQEVAYRVEELEKRGIMVQEMLLAALFEGGYLPKEAICVKSIDTKP
ncbi:MAG: hypothetical protein IKV99_04125 [Oscillospiraceae bacterium]|nr:hypothetical protein [Oscillospiraceae bacterium]